MYKCNRCEEDDCIYFNNYIGKLLCKRCDGMSDIIEGNSERKCKRCNETNFECKESEKYCQKCWDFMSHYILEFSPNKEASIIGKNYKEDIINKPNHYHANGIDPIGLGKKLFTEEEMLGFYKMNVLKYRMRAGKKQGNSEEQDLSKAEFYAKKIKEVYDARIHCRRK